MDMSREVYNPQLSISAHRSCQKIERKKIFFLISTPCLSAPTEFTQESSPVKMCPVKLLPAI